MAKTTRKKKATTDPIVDEILAPMIEYCKQRGKLNEIFDKYNARSKTKIGFTAVWRWLCADRSKAFTPNGGPLLTLLEVWRDIRGVDVVNRPEPTIYCAANGHQPDHDGKSCKKCACKL